MGVTLVGTVATLSVNSCRKEKNDKRSEKTFKRDIWI